MMRERSRTLRLEQMRSETLRCAVDQMVRELCSATFRLRGTGSDDARTRTSFRSADRTLLSGQLGLLLLLLIDRHVAVGGAHVQMMRERTAWLRQRSASRVRIRSQHINRLARLRCAAVDELRHGGSAFCRRRRRSVRRRLDDPVRSVRGCGTTTTTFHGAVVADQLDATLRVGRESIDGAQVQVVRKRSATHFRFEWRTATFGATFTNGGALVRTMGGSGTRHFVSWWQKMLGSTTMCALNEVRKRSDRSSARALTFSVSAAPHRLAHKRMHISAIACPFTHSSSVYG